MRSGERKPADFPAQWILYKNLILQLDSARFLLRSRIKRVRRAPMYYLVAHLRRPTLHNSNKNNRKSDVELRKQSGHKRTRLACEPSFACPC